MVDMLLLKSEDRNIKGEAISKGNQQKILWNDAVKTCRHTYT